MAYVSCGGSLVEYNGKLVSVCNPDYILRYHPYLKIVLSLSLFLFLLITSIGLVYLVWKDKIEKLETRELILIVLAAIICFGFSIHWLIYAIKTISN